MNTVHKFKLNLLDNYWYFFDIIPEDIFEDFFNIYIESGKFEIDETFESFVFYCVLVPVFY